MTPRKAPKKIPPAAAFLTKAPGLHTPLPVLSLKGDLSLGWGAHSSDPAVSLLKGVEPRGKEKSRRCKMYTKDANPPPRGTWRHLLRHLLLGRAFCMDGWGTRYMWLGANLENNSNDSPVAGLDNGLKISWQGHHHQSPATGPHLPDGARGTQNSEGMKEHYMGLECARPWTRLPQ